MSTDYDAACLTCHVYRHLGQRMGGGWSFGFGSNDTDGRAVVGEFIQEHAGHELRVFVSEETPVDFRDACGRCAICGQPYGPCEPTHCAADEPKRCPGCGLVVAPGHIGTITEPRGNGPPWQSRCPACIQREAAKAKAAIFGGTEALK